MTGRIIISGGTGLIGAQLAKSLLADGHEVVILTRQSQPKAPIDSARYAQWDGQRLGDWSAQLSGAAAIVNLAGAGIAGEGPLPSRWTNERKSLLRQSRLSAGRILARAAELAAPPPPVFIQASAVGYYGTQQSGLLMEETPAGDDFLARLCVEWESCSVGVEALGARRVIARLGVVLSADGGALPKMALPFRLFVGSWLGSGQQQLSWIHLDDAVAALRFLLDQEKASGTYNVCAPQPLSNSAFSGELAHALRRPCWLRLPAFAMKLAFGEVSQTLLEGQAAIPQRLTAAGFVHTYPDARSALEEIYGN